MITSIMLSYSICTALVRNSAHRTVYCFDHSCIEILGDLLKAFVQRGGRLNSVDYQRDDVWANCLTPARRFAVQTAGAIEKTNYFAFISVKNPWAVAKALFF